MCVIAEAAIAICSNLAYLTMIHFDDDAQPLLARRYAPADRSIPRLLAQQATLGDKPLIILRDTAFSYADMAARASATGALLRAAGVAQGDRVAILCGNRIEFLDLFLGCAWIGAVAVPINHFARGPQLQHILGNSGARLLAADADGAAALEHIDASKLALSEIWLLGAEDRTIAPPALPAGWKVGPMPPLAGGTEAATPRPGDMAAIIYTSGTTGPSKGVCCPHAQFFWWGVHSVELLEIEAHDVLLTTLPLFHVNALATFFSALLSGATLVTLDRFSASGFAASLRKYKATVTYLLGAMVSILLSTPPSDGDRDHPTTRALAPGVSAGLSAAFRARFGIGPIDGYGSTETNFVIGDRLADQKPGCMGRIRPGFDGRVVDDEDNEVPPGVPGELVVRADMPFAMATGYFELAPATVAAWRNLWLHTGDRVTRDADGYFTFMDRIKDAIRRRGENISAYEVEQVLLSHPAVAYAAVFPVRSELTEDEVMTAVVLKDGFALAPAELLDFCKPRMSYFSVPRYVLFADSLPMTENGKVQKYRLREAGVTPATWDREAAGYKVGRGEAART
jgi:crotonobetaine/carnitine-CoA ligase